MTEIERRFAAQPAELRADPQARSLEWYPAVFSVLSSEIMGFRERLQRGCFSKSLREQDIHALVNHDPSAILGRNKAGTLELRENAKGLFAKVKLPNTTTANDLLENIRAGNIDGGSFAFTVVGQGEKWSTEKGEVIRTILEARLYDVSIVTLGAYPDAGDVVAHGAQLAALETRHQLIGPPTTQQARSEPNVGAIVRYPHGGPRSIAELRRELAERERAFNATPDVQSVVAHEAVTSHTFSSRDLRGYAPLPRGMAYFSPRGPDWAPISGEMLALAAGAKIADPPRTEAEPTRRFWPFGR